MHSSITYKTNTANENEVYAHLLACNLNFVPPLSTRIDLQAYAKKLANVAITFEAWQHNHLQGLIAAYFNDTDAQAFITNVSVVKELMGAGIAAQLLRMTEELAAGRNLTAIKLEVNENNQPAIKFYTKHGYELDDSKEDFLVMIKKIA